MLCRSVVTRPVSGLDPAAAGSLYDCIRERIYYSYVYTRLNLGSPARRGSAVSTAFGKDRTHRCILVQDRVR